MTLLAQLPAEAGWQVEIVATDLSTRVLALARAGTYPLARAADIPERYLKRFVLRGVRSQEGCIRVARDVRDRVSFERLNLSSGAVPGGAAFDLVLCRNVLIYFDAASKARVLERLVARLATKGVLLLGHSETLGGADLGLRPLAPNAYFKPAAA
jgi:chemotaxis protein methyltransferase CheR